MAEIDITSWYIGKDFTTDWTSHNFPIWSEVLASRRAAPLRILEIGSWEGRSAVVFLNYLSQSDITCVDTFVGSADHAFNPEWAKSVADCERRFDANLAEFGSRVKKVKDDSSRALVRFALEQRRFDLAYIDGSHLSVDVYLDCALVWPLLTGGAIAIIDDYAWDLAPTEEERPKLGIDTFLATQVGNYIELHRGYQLIIRKQ